MTQLVAGHVAILLIGVMGSSFERYKGQNNRRGSGSKVHFDVVKLEDKG